MGTAHRRDTLRRPPGLKKCPKASLPPSSDHCCSKPGAEQGASVGHKHWNASPALPSGECPGADQQPLRPGAQTAPRKLLHRRSAVTTGHRRPSTVARGEARLQLCSGAR